MRATRLLYLAILGGAACSDSSVGPSDAAPAPSLTSIAPRDYGFFSRPGGSSAAAITNGYVKCSASGNGAVQWFLPLNAAAISRALATVRAGGSATIEVPTRFYVSGVGQFNGTETITAAGATQTRTVSRSFLLWGSEGIPATAVFPVTEAQLAAGYFEVIQTATVTASLPFHCGKSSAGMIRWGVTMPRLRLQ